MLPNALTVDTGHCCVDLSCGRLLPPALRLSAGGWPVHHAAEPSLTFLRAYVDQMVLGMNQKYRSTGDSGLDVPALCTAYVDVLRRRTAIAGRSDAFVPLGEVELTALCRLYVVRLQTVKSEAVRDMTKQRKLAAERRNRGKSGSSSGGEGGSSGHVAGAAVSIDPRCIRAEHINDRPPQRDDSLVAAAGDGGGAVDWDRLRSCRVVRMLNVNTNRKWRWGLMMRCHPCSPTTC